MTLNKKNILIYFSIIYSFNLVASEFKPYAAFDLGYDILHTNKNGETNKNGYDLGTKLVGSFKFEKFYLDGGLGYQYESLFGNGISQQTSAPFCEFAFRFRLNEFWSFGPITQLHFAEDNSRSENNGKNNSMWNIGGQLMFDPNLIILPVRFETMITRDLSGLGDRELYSIKFGINIPFGEGSPRENKQNFYHNHNQYFHHSKTNGSLPIVVVPAIIKKEIYIKTDNETLKASMNSSVVGFKPNSSELDVRSSKKIKRLGEYLVNHHIVMQHIGVSGHTDRQGSRKYNLKLSEARAQSVKKVLLNSGVKIKILTYGYGFSRPIDDRDSNEALEKNRRTEIEFINVENNANLIEELNDIIKEND